jgi:hypothetical protein
MENNAPASGTSTPADHRPAARTDQPSSANEWLEIGRLIERQIRRDVARIVGASESDDWGDVRDTVASRLRERAAGVDATEVGQRAERIMRDVEEQLRVGLAQTVGAGQDADWSSIGRTVGERLRQTIDRSQPIGPGGSGTAASAEDAAVPAATPSPDAPPRPARAAGDDTGLPTVTDEVGELPRRPPLEAR